MVYSTTWKYKDLHSIQRVKSVKIHVIYLFIYLLFSHNKDYTSITLYKDVARGPQKTTRLVRGGPLVTIILSNRTITAVNGFIQLINSQISCCFVLTNDNPGFYEKQILLHRVLSYLSRDICGWLCHVKAKSLS